MIKGPYYTLIKRYLNSFSNPHISTKIYSVNSIMEDIGGAVISLVVSAMLNYTTTAYATLFIGIITLIAFIVVLDYMKTRLGLAPEEYRKQDIEFIPKVKQLTSQDIEKNNIEISISIDENGENRIDISDIN